MSRLSSSCRKLALRAYYHGTAPFRSRMRDRLAAEGRVPVCVLFYHRVADTHPNSWSMTNAQFKQQIHWLQKHAEIVPLSEVQRRIESGHNDRIAVAITFDDGYADNCDQAIPYLIENKIPATYFVTHDSVVNQRSFPQDIAEGIPLRPNTLDQIREMAGSGIEIGAHTRTHCNVAAITDPAVLVDEIVTASRELSDLIGQPIKYFAFPYGTPNTMSAEAVRLAKQAGMQGVCSAFGAYNWPGQDPYHIRRIHGDPQFIRLKNWLTLDRRKFSVGVDFQFTPTDLSLPPVIAPITTAPGTITPAAGSLS
ncbi:polysaccharide deacetylase family protein [Stieleria varia]|uniref:Poly-beta-1,6-N-acetyl-D-glucosamine N-deacetylase n=1 Tax=Stieleria varia TaxID=2528005 RepID=A0A5C6AST6_9BACT|nr:polysaccharide deacetylase family protein [Stieleria varia]TWU02487.1 Poly-beta-1,6-N-acetyl-D-glucosamine N-deacetylase precursor [Stieleria varia]